MTRAPAAGDNATYGWQERKGPYGVTAEDLPLKILAKTLARADYDTDFGKVKSREIVSYSGRALGIGARSATRPHMPDVAHGGEKR